ncbi:MAG: hypothetical protein GEU82_07375 [Luteitalea sp.]|nr:hypothetical protein [Luteitalea sp.]
MHMQNERGIALVLALLLTSVLSVLAASLMFLSQTETYASMNYRMMSQGRFAAEAGVHKAANFLTDPTQYDPGDAAETPIVSFNRAVSPVTTLDGSPVVLSTDAAKANYPVAAVQTAFAEAAFGSLNVGNASMTYGSTATLMAMQSFEAYGGTTGVVQTWEITGIGGVSGARPATVEVTAVIETPKVPANSYAAFATSKECGSLYFHGNVTIDSYDSSEGPPTGAGESTEDSSGNVGTNGNMQIAGSVEVQGNLYTPRTGVGTCSAGAVTALTTSGKAQVNGSTVQLPRDLEFAVPVFDAPRNQVTITAASISTAALAADTCAQLGLTYGAPIAGAAAGTTTATFPGNCTVDTASSTLIVVGRGTDVTMPSVTVTGATLRFVGNAGPSQAVHINSITGSGNIEIEANMAANTGEAVVLKVAGLNPDGTEMTTPFNLAAMGWKQNSPVSSYDAAAFQLIYGGSQIIEMKGGNTQSAVSIYAPNAAFNLRGTQDLFGSVLASTIENHGNANIHYDRRLGNGFYVQGNVMMGSFSWRRY